MLDHLQTEGRNPASSNLDELSALEIVHLMNAEDAKVAAAVATQAEAIARAIDIIADRLRQGGRLIYAGAGTSGRLGVLDATECPPTFRSPPGQVVGIIAGGPEALTRAVEGAEDHPEHAERDLDALKLSGIDVVAGIATSGRTPYVLGAVRRARRLGAFTIGISCNSDSELTPEVDIAITPVVGPEILSGSTRLKAGTATKLVLNMLTTGAMVRLGKTYGNLMVDLRATNFKLRVRSNRIVRQVTGLDKETAEALLQRCGGEVKTALVAHFAGVDAEEARRRLESAGGRVRQAISPLSPWGRGVGGEGKSQHPDIKHLNPGCSPFPSPPTPLPASGERGVLLGIDGGGTHTVALLATPDGQILGRGVAGPSNLHSAGTDRALHALDQAIAAAFAAAGLPEQPVQSACLGLAGADREAEQATLRAWSTRRKLCDCLQLTTDAALVLAAGTSDNWGLALVAGTGSIAVGRAPDGCTARAGGWGYLIGDEGSGYRITLAALQAVARAADGRGPATSLTSTFLKRLHLQEPKNLVTVIYSAGWDRAALAGLAPLVFEEADGDDEVARAILDDAARQLAETGAAVVRQLGLHAILPLAMAGGCLLASLGYRNRVVTALQRLGISCQPVKEVPEPAVGAVTLAKAAALASRDRG
jgi:N-acetylmuramic acid 6-phosphate etherase